MDLFWKENVPIALLPQAARTQDVAAPWIAAVFAVVHWHLMSVIAQVVADLTASAIQVVAQAGMVLWAVATAARAMRPKAESEYCILMVVGGVD